MMCEAGSKELRKGRFSSGEVSYFVTICSYKRNYISGITVFEAIRIAFGWLEANSYIKLFCFILMLDHIHAVLQLTGDKNLSEVVSNFKISVVKQLKGKIESSKFWQQGFFDHRIRKDEQFMQVVFYCYNNPYRTGIIDIEEHYQFWYCESGIQKELDKRMDFYRARETEGNSFNPRLRER
jgi:REP element-mobilizing transposase RayT